DFHVTGVQTCALPISLTYELSDAGKGLQRASPNSVIRHDVADANCADVIYQVLAQSLKVRRVQCPRLYVNGEPLQVLLLSPGREIGRASCRGSGWVVV